MSNLGEEKKTENAIEGEAVSGYAAETGTQGVSDDSTPGKETCTEKESLDPGREIRTEGVSDDPATEKETSTEKAAESPITVEETRTEGVSDDPATEKETSTEKAEESPAPGEETQTENGAGSRKKSGFKLGERGKIAIIVTSVILVIALIVSLAVLSFKDRQYDEAEVIAAAKELLPTAGKLYSVYYGNGIAYMSSGHSDGDYREADPFHLATLGIGSVQDLKNMSYATFSTDYCENIFSNYLESYEEDGIVYNWARYVQVYDTSNAESPAYILVYSKHDGIFEDRMTYDLSSIKAVRSKGEYVYMSVDVIVESIEGETQTATISFTLFEESTGWRIASPAFANYNKYLDHELLQ